MGMYIWYNNIVWDFECTYNLFTDSKKAIDHAVNQLNRFGMI